MFKETKGCVHVLGFKLRLENGAVATVLVPEDDVVYERGNRAFVMAADSHALHGIKSGTFSLMCYYVI